MEYIKSFIHGGRYQDAIDLIDEYLQLYPKEPSSDRYRGLKAYALHKKGRYQESLALCELLLEKIESGSLYAYVADILGLNYWKLGKFEESKHWIKISIEEYHVLNDKNGMGLAYNDLGLVFMAKGHIQDALNSFQKSIDLLNEERNSIDIAYAYGNLGKINLIQGKFTLAEKFLRDAERIFLEVGNENNLAYIYKNYGNIYEITGEVSRAIEMYLRALELRKKYGNPLEISECLVFLCRSFHRSGDKEQYDLYYTKLEEIVKSGAPDHANIYLNYIQGLQIIGLRRVFAKFTAKPKLELVIQHPSTPFELKVDAILVLLGLLFLELEIADASKEIIEEIETYIYMLQKNVEWSHSPILKVELLLIESKFSVLHMRFKEAKDKLLEAEMVCNDIESLYVNQLVKKRIAELEENLVKWQEAINKNPRTKKEIEEVDIVEYMKKIVKLEFD